MRVRGKKGRKKRREEYHGVGERWRVLWKGEKGKRRVKKRREGKRERR